MVAVSIFMVAFSVMTIFVSNYVADDAAGDNSEVAAIASDALDLLVTNPGLPSDWYTTGTPERLGLLKQGSETTMDLRKVRQLRSDGGGMSYGDAKRALGFSHHDFHLRSYPDYILDEDGRSGDLDGYRAAYVGDHTAGGVETTASRVESGALGALGLTFTNGSAENAVRPLDAGDKYQDDKRHLSKHLITRLHGLVYNDDGLSTEHSLFPNDDSYWSVVDLTNVTADMDPDHRNLLTASLYNVTDQEWTYSNGANDRIIIARVNLSDYADGDEVWLNLTHYADGYAVDPGGLLPLEIYDYGEVHVRGVDDVTWTTEATEIHNEGTNETFVEKSISLDGWAGDDILISLVWHTEVTTGKGEGWFVGGFTVEARKDQNSTTLVDNQLDYTHTPYDVLVVGSDVDQSTLKGGLTTLTAAAINQWVEAGGDVVALGSEDMATEWVARFVKGDTKSANGPLLIGLSDPTHPILNSPHSLDYFDWDTSDATYGVRSSDTTFTQVLLRESGGTPLPILSASNANAQWDGNLVLTSYRAHAIPSDQRLNMLENYLLYARFNDVYLEFGPSIPDGATVASADTAGLVDTSDLGLGVIDYRIVLYVWE